MQQGIWRVSIGVIGGLLCLWLWVSVAPAHQPATHGNPSSRPAARHVSQAPAPLPARLRSDARYLRDADKLKRALAATKLRLKPLLASIAAEREAIIQDWIKIAEIPAPSKREQRRGAYIAGLFRAAGLQVSTDPMGNVIGYLSGISGTSSKFNNSNQSNKGIAFLAHLDTVFGASVSHKVQRKGHWLHGPGIGDDTSGLITLVTLARLFQRHKLRFARDIWLVASVQEEIGLIGARAFVKQYQHRLAAVASIDGGYGGISYGALGIEWFKVTFVGKGNHTLSSTGKPSTTHAVARAINQIYQLRAPQEPFMRRTWFNVGRMGAGRVINAQAAEAWFTLDLRSMSAIELQRLKQAIFGIVNATAYQIGVTAKIRQLQGLTAAQIPYGDRLYLVQAAKAVLQDQGHQSISLSPIGSSDHCTAVALGIPGINIGVVRGQGAHTLRERVDTRPLVKGIQHVALLLGLLAEAPSTPSSAHR